jgi:hypothetical protein
MPSVSVSFDVRGSSNAKRSRASLSAVSASFATQFAVGYNLRISEDLNVLQNPDSPEAQMMAAWTTPTALANQRNHPYLLLENTATTDNRGSGNAALTTFSITVGDPVIVEDGEIGIVAVGDESIVAVGEGDAAIVTVADRVAEAGASN